MELKQVTETRGFAGLTETEVRAICAALSAPDYQVRLPSHGDRLDFSLLARAGIVTAVRRQRGTMFVGMFVLTPAGLVVAKACEYAASEAVRHHARARDLLESIIDMCRGGKTVEEIREVLEQALDRLGPRFVSPLN